MLERGISGLIAALQSKKMKTSFDLWQLRLEHIPFYVISHLNKLGHLLIFSLLSNPTSCSCCQLAKRKRLSFALDEKRVACVLI